MNFKFSFSVSSFEDWETEYIAVDRIKIFMCLFDCIDEVWFEVLRNVEFLCLLKRE